MRLSKRDRDILSRITFHADESLQTLARISKHRIHSVRYLLDRLHEANAIEKNWMIDPLLLGWQRFHLMFSLELTPGQEKQKLIDYFKSCDQVCSFAEYGGDFDFQINVLARDVRELLAILKSATKQSGMLFFSKSLTLQHRLAYFPRKYFTTGTIEYKPMVLGEFRQQKKISKTDHKILCYLSRHPNIEKKELAELVNVSVSTLHSHFNDLRKQQIIRGAMFSLRGSFDGLQNYRLLIFTRGMDNRLDKQMFTFANNCLYCRSYGEGFGGAEYELGLEVEHYQQLSAVKEELCSLFSGKISSIIVLPRIQRHKLLTYPFNPDDENFVTPYGKRVKTDSYLV